MQGISLLPLNEVCYGRFKSTKIRNDKGEDQAARTDCGVKLGHKTE